jgi:hypothetical protein
MKTLINLIAIGFFIYILHDVDFTKVNNTINNIDNGIQNNNTEDGVNTAQIRRTFKIVCLGDVDVRELQDTINEVLTHLRGNNIHINLEYQDNIESIEEFMINDEEGVSSGIIDNQKFLQTYSENTSVIFFTDKKLYDSNLRDYVRGYSTGVNLITRVGNGFIKETLIHELGHVLGLPHCEDLSCIMAINNDEYDSGNFCKKCKRDLFN